MENLIRFNAIFNELQFLAALGGALGITAGVINAVALVAVFGSLVGAIISAMGERNTGGIKTSLVIGGRGCGVASGSSNVCRRWRRTERANAGHHRRLCQFL